MRIPQEDVRSRKQRRKEGFQVLLVALVFGLMYLLILHRPPFFFPESPWAHADSYHTDEQHVHISPKPADCDFLYAPMGIKGCHYARSVQVTRYSTDDHSGQPIVSYEDGKVWTLLPEGEKTGPTEVYVSWIGWGIRSG